VIILALKVKAYNEDSLVNSDVDMCTCNNKTTTHIVLENNMFMEICDNCNKFINNEIYKLEKGEKNEKD